MTLREPLIQKEQNGCALRLTSDVCALGVFLEAENDVQPSDNCFDLMPGVAKEIIFDAEPGNVEIFDIASMRADWV